MLICKGSTILFSRSDTAIWHTTSRDDKVIFFFSLEDE